MSTFHDSILKLKHDYNKLWWFQKLFFPSQLAHELSSYPEKSPTILDVHYMLNALIEHVYIEKTWFFQGWFIEPLKISNVERLDFPNFYLEPQLCISELKRAHSQLGWFQKLFFPSQLAKTLTDYPELNSKSDHQFAVFNAFEKNTWFFHRWFFRPLRRFGEHPSFELFLESDDLISAKIDDNQVKFKKLEELLKIANRWIIYDFGKFIKNIHLKSLLPSDSAQFASESIFPYQSTDKDFVSACNSLYNAGLLTGDCGLENSNAIIKNFRFNNKLIIGINFLENAGLLKGQLAQANLNTLLIDVNLNHIDVFFSDFELTSLFKGNDAQANFNASLAHEDFVYVGHIISKLKSTSLFKGDDAQANFKALLALKNPEDLGNVVSEFKQRTSSNVVITQDIFNEILCKYKNNTASLPLNQEVNNTTHSINPFRLFTQATQTAEDYSPSISLVPHC
jgi:hypothetical protein